MSSQQGKKNDGKNDTRKKKEKTDPPKHQSKAERIFPFHRGIPFPDPSFIPDPELNTGQPF